SWTIFYSSFSALLPPLSTPFPYTTLFRSLQRRQERSVQAELDRQRQVLQRRAAGPVDGAEAARADQLLQPVVRAALPGSDGAARSEEHTSELQSHLNLVCRLLLEKKKIKI